MPEFTLPDPGEGLVEATIVQWKVAVGDTVKTNDIVVEVETAKSLVELPIPWDGTVTAILAQEGDEVEVGAPIITIDTGDGAGAGGGSAGEGAGDEAAGAGGAGADAGGTTPEDVTDAATAASDDMVPTPPAGGGDEGGSGSGGPGSGPDGSGSGGPGGREAMLVGYGAIETATTRRRRRGAAAAEEAAEQAGAPRRAKAAPPVRKYAKDRGVDLTQVTPSREDGVVTRADVDSHLAGDAASESAQHAAAEHAVPPAQGAATGDAAPGVGPDAGTTAGPSGSARDGAGGSRTTAYQRPTLSRSGEREERTEVKGVRKMMAQAMVSSAFTAPHVTEFVTVDVTRTMDLIERLKRDRELRDLKVGPLLLLARAMCLAVRRNPGMNAVWDDEAQQVVQRNYVNLGIAAATPRGLVVPNIKDADLMDLRQLAEALGDLVATAKAGRTQPADMSGGTITITNVGVFGVDTGTPIINPGESAIVAFGAVRRMPWVVGEGADERIEPRWVTQLAVSFDHRLIDGELGSRFLADLAALMEDPARALVWG